MTKNKTYKENTTLTDIERTDLIFGDVAMKKKLKESINAMHELNYLEIE